MVGLIYLAVALLVLVIKTRQVKPHFHYEKVGIVFLSLFWPVALFSWSVTNFCVLLIDLINEGQT